MAEFSELSVPMRIEVQSIFLSQYSRMTEAIRHYFMSILRDVGGYPYKDERKCALEAGLEELGEYLSTYEDVAYFPYVLNAEYIQEIPEREEFNVNNSVTIICYSLHIRSMVRELLSKVRLIEARALVVSSTDRCLYFVRAIEELLKSQFATLNADEIQALAKKYLPKPFSLKI